MLKWKASRTTWIANESGIPDQGAVSPLNKEADFERIKASISDPKKPLSQQLSSADLDELCSALPKVELHAHMSGTVKESTLKQLLVASGGMNTLTRENNCMILNFS